MSYSWVSPFCPTPTRVGAESVLRVAQLDELHDKYNSRTQLSINSSPTWGSNILWGNQIFRAGTICFLRETMPGSTTVSPFTSTSNEAVIICLVSSLYVMAVASSFSFL